MGEVGVYHSVEGSTYIIIYFLDFKNLMRGTYFKLGAYSSSLGDCNVRVFFLSNI